MSAIVMAPTAANILRQSPWPVLRQLVVTESEDEVVISGDVTSYYHKQLAQEAVRPLLRSRRLRNMVCVQAPR